MNSLILLGALRISDDYDAVFNLPTGKTGEAATGLESFVGAPPASLRGLEYAAAVLLIPLAIAACIGMRRATRTHTPR